MQRSIIGRVLVNKRSFLWMGLATIGDELQVTLGRHAIQFGLAKGGIERKGKLLLIAAEKALVSGHDGSLLFLVSVS